MRRFFCIITTVSVLLLFSLSVVSSTFAAPYGEDAYGDCEFGTGCEPTPTLAPTSAPSNNSSNGSQTSSGSSSSGCSDTPPSSAPDLFQIDRHKTTATLLFAPAGNPYNNYYIVYGYSEADERFAIGFNNSNSPGAITYTISELSPKTVYYFKVRGGYGCASGPWSQSMWTQGVTGTRKVSFYPQKKSVVSTIYNTVNNLKTTVVMPKSTLNVSPQTPAKQNIPTQKKTTSQAKSADTKTPAPESKSWWENILDFFR